MGSIDCSAVELSRIAETATRLAGMWSQVNGTAGEELIAELSAFINDLASSANGTVGRIEELHDLQSTTTAMTTRTPNYLDGG